MKTKKLESGLTALAVVISVEAHVGFAADYKVDWQTLDGGGGNCSGGKLSLSGTAGQPDAGFSTGSTYVHQGGFVPAFQKDVGPRLSVMRSMGNLNFTWAGACTGFSMEGAQSVTGPWTALGSGTLSDGNYQLTLTPPTPYRFFRLRKDCPQ